MIRKFKILLVEDEIDISDIVSDNLNLAGYDTDSVISAEEAMKLDLTGYDLFILDIMLEIMTGTELAELIRADKKLKDKPVIFLTARNSEENKLEGFRIGADDYITKPFSVNELIARVNAILKRTYPAQYEKDGIVIDDLRKTVIVNGGEVILTKKEYLLLETLVKNKNVLFSRTQLLDIVWEDDGSVTDRAVDVMIRRLRKKLGTEGSRIKTRSGLGYIFDL